MSLNFSTPEDLVNTIISRDVNFSPKTQIMLFGGEFYWGDGVNNLFTNLFYFIFLSISSLMDFIIWGFKSIQKKFSIFSNLWFFWGKIQFLWE